MSTGSAAAYCLLQYSVTESFAHYYHTLTCAFRMRVANAIST
jgi:hypothetical protein